MNIILSTRNPSKAEQIKAMFLDTSITVLTLAEAGISGEAEEDGATLEENALKKAMYAYERAVSGSWAMADDTGLFIDALNGEPGIKAARWAGENARTEEITIHTLNALKDATDRSATFETVVVLISPEGQKHAFSGKVRGKLLGAPRVPAQPKMPYSPIFVPDGSDLVLAQMTVEQENAISHRGKAFRLTRSFLETQSQ